MTLDDAVRDVQPQSQPHAGARLHINAARPKEALEHVRYILRRNAHTLIADTQPGDTARATVRLHSRPIQRHSDGRLFGTVLQRVGYQIVHHLGEPEGVAYHHNWLLWGGQRYLAPWRRGGLP